MCAPRSSASIVVPLFFVLVGEWRCLAGRARSQPRGFASRFTSPEGLGKGTVGLVHPSVVVFDYFEADFVHLHWLEGPRGFQTGPGRCVDRLRQQIAIP